MKNVYVKNLVFNDRIPKICVPIIGGTDNEILNDINNLKDYDFDLVEIRIDYYKNVEEFEKVLNILSEIKKILHKPILFTFRTKEEGGNHEMSEDMYFDLSNAVIESKLIDLVDIELFSHREKIKETIDIAHKNDIKVIMSNHDFCKTPSKNEIINRLVKMQSYETDITKIAVMPNCEEDIITLLEATLEMKKRIGDRPFITMSMGSLGIITRLTGSLTGSCLTFAALNKSSAPGQLNVKNARELLNMLNIN